MFVNDLQLKNIPNDITNMIVTQYLAYDFKSLGKLSITCKNNNAKLKDFIISSFAEIYKKMISKRTYYTNLLFYKKLNLAMIVNQIKQDPCKYKLQDSCKYKESIPEINIQKKKCN